MRRVFLTLLLLTGCKPPATDDYLARVPIEARAAPSDPIASPETADAVWAQSRDADRIIYGTPGRRPLMALACVPGAPAATGPQIAFERLVRADPGAQAILALIGNSHVTRLFVDAVEVGEVWTWRGATPAQNPALDVLTGGRSVEATVPGAGSVILNASPIPGALIDRCRAQAERIRPPATPADPG